MPRRGPKETVDLRASLACQDFRDPWGLQGFLGLMELKVTKEIQAGQEHPVSQGPRETLDSRACLALVALQESQALRVIWGLQEFQDFKVQKVFLASRELKVIKAIKVSRELKVSRVLLAPQVLTTSSKGSPGSLVLRAPQG